MSKETKEAAKPAKAAEKPAEKKPAEPVINYVTSTQLAEKLGTKPTILRRWLRTLPKFQDGGYTRYKWDPNDTADAQFLKDAEASFKKHQSQAEEKKAARLDEARKAAEGKPAKEKKSKKKAAEPAEEEVDEGSDDAMEDSEEGEELD